MTIDKRILDIAGKVTGKRPRTVIDHIIKHGSINSDILKDTYDYSHPPRAIRDVRESGIPLVTTRVTGKDGRKIASYTFGNPDDIENFKLSGRQTFSKKFKDDLIEKYGSVCMTSGLDFESRYLQIDHRIPYEVAGEQLGGEDNLDKFMLLSGSAQRQKSWSCENCSNLKKEKDIDVCKTCYWVRPEEYSHIALRKIKQVTLNFENSDIEIYKTIESAAQGSNIKPGDYILKVLKDHLSK